MNDKSDASSVHPPTSSGSDVVWSYRGYHLRSSEFATAMVHYYRAEISRANVWRQRLDTTTNWAVVATGAAVTIAFGQALGHHGVILLNILLVTLFLFIEARRYRYYEVWSYRIRLMETDFFAAMLVPPFGPSSDWAESLAENLLQPNFRISMWEALGRRYRRNYFWILSILGLAWIIRVWLLPEPANTWLEFFGRAGIGSIPGEAILAAGIIYNVFWVLIGILTVGLHEASGEVLPRFLAEANIPTSATEEHPGKLKPWFRHTGRRRQLMGFIITSKGEAISRILLQELKRGVTSIPGVGMYTGTSRSVLLCAVTVTEIAHMKALVRDQDPDAFVIVSPVQEILGGGFLPLRNP